MFNMLYYSDCKIFINISPCQFAFVSVNYLSVNDFHLAKDIVDIWSILITFHFLIKKILWLFKTTDKFVKYKMGKIAHKHMSYK